MTKPGIILRNSDPPRPSIFRTFRRLLMFASLARETLGTHLTADKHTFSKIFETQNRTGKAIVPMEGLRGFAAFLVFLVHYVTLVRPWILPASFTYVFANALETIGHSGVDLFFVLSGYLIYGALLAKRRPFVPYFARRVERIYPTFLAVFCLYLALSFAFPSESKLPSDIRDAITYICANLLLLPGMFNIQPMITVAWSLSYEMFFYLAIPIGITTLGLRLWRSGARAIFFVIIAVVVVSSPWIVGDHIRLVMFLAGMVLHDTLRPSDGRVLGLCGLFALLVGLLGSYVIEHCAAGKAARITVLFVSYYVLCYACFQNGGISSRLFSWTPLRWFGNMSYSYYLIHGLSLKAVFLVLNIAFPPQSTSVVAFWTLLPPMFLLSLVPSGLLFICVERPCSLANRKSRKNVTPVVAA